MKSRLLLSDEQREMVMGRILPLIREAIENVRQYRHGNSWELAEDHMVNLIGNLGADIAVSLMMDPYEAGESP